MHPNRRDNSRIDKPSRQPPGGSASYKTTLEPLVITQP